MVCVYACRLATIGLLLTSLMAIFLTWITTDLSYGSFIPYANVCSRSQFSIMETTVIKCGLCLLASALMNYYSLYY